jgi:hypothetical protein
MKTRWAQESTKKKMEKERMKYDSEYNVSDNDVVLAVYESIGWSLVIWPRLIRRQKQSEPQRSPFLHWSR